MPISQLLDTDPLALIALGGFAILIIVTVLIFGFIGLRLMTQKPKPTDNQ